MVGCLGNIYESIENINITYLQPNLNKETLLKSKVPISGGGTGVTLLLPKVTPSISSTSRHWYRCSRTRYSDCYSYVSNDSNAKCPSCQGSMNDDVNFVDPSRATNTESHRVLFAEADKNFIDFLFHILALPVGTFIALLTKQGMVGSLGNIYESIENLNITYLQPNLNKETLLKPKVHIPGGGPFIVDGNDCKDYVADDNRAICPSCEKVMSHKLNFVPSPRATNAGSSSSEGGYVKGVVTYMVMDDLVVKPMSTISSITLLNSFNVKDLGALEEKVIHLGIDEGVKLLKASLRSKNVLTDVFLPMLKVEIESVL
ncbi:hypothetical protein CMV_023493 [Castanea mollissima]|uniref:DUF674 domain-containing protein n=1 Tax=Castanea mollissima TaxID=60419 RepID=A0A8J4QJI9_9ROSI|nr:hypothetical protein CMV_023493 [Castanea mollissima]